MATKVRTVYARVTVTVAVTLGCLVLMELALRFIVPIHRFVNAGSSFHRFDPETGWLGIADRDARFVGGTGDFDVRIRHSAEGFRLHEGATAPPSAPIWVFLGDSFTWGWGVEQGECFTNRLQEMLGDRASIRNHGVNAFGTVQQSLLLERLIKEGLRPHLVVVMMFANDFSDNVSPSNDKPYVVTSGDQVSLTNFPITSNHYSRGWVRDLFDRSRLWNTIAATANMWKARFNASRAGFGVGQMTEVSEEQVRAMRWALERLRYSCREVGAELVVALIPHPKELNVDGATPVQAESARLCEELQLRWFDLTMAIERACGGDPCKLYFLRDAHWTAEGHQVAATALRDALNP